MLNTVEDRATDRSVQHRSFTVADLEMREDTSSGVIRFEGVASVVGTPYSVRDHLGEFTETMNAGAFHRTIRQKADVRMLKNHNSDFVFARTKSGTLELADDPHLRASAPSLDPANPQVQTLRSELARGDVDQMSIGFRVKDDVWNDDYTERTIKEIELIEVSVVTFPASPTTSAGLRSIDELMTMITDFDNVDEAQIVRAINMLQAMLSTEEVDQAIAARDLADRDRLARKIADRPALVCV
jgi:HK97 family phage prohead protease